MTALHRVVATPLGAMDLVLSAAVEVLVFDFRRDGQASHGLRKAQATITVNSVDDDPVFAPVLDQIQAYFAGKRHTFELSFQPLGTDFQQLVWQQLCAIPFGETRTYGELAQALGKPTAARAVGAANGRNPVAVLIPCHRVIGGNGQLTGYAGGIDNKRWLLQHEGAPLH